MHLGSGRTRFVFAATLMETELPLGHSWHLIYLPPLAPFGAVIPVGCRVNATASSRTSGFMKNVLSRRVKFTCTPIALSSAATMGPTAATTLRSRPCRSSASRPKARATSRNRRTWGALVKAIASRARALLQGDLLIGIDGRQRLSVVTALEAKDSVAELSRLSLSGQGSPSWKMV